MARISLKSSERKTMSFDWIADSTTLDAWLAAAPAHAHAGLDTEFMRTNTFAPKLALVQLNIDGRTALIDAPLLGAHAGLGGRLGDRANLFIMHSASEDLDALSALLPNGPGELFDTQIAAAIAGVGFGLSYQKLVATLLGIDLPKSETRSDWLQRPLSAAQLDYAAQDVVHLAELHALLSTKLDALGRAEWLREDCRRLIDRVVHAQPDPQPQLAFRGASEWPREAQMRLRRLLLWREASARTLDKPRPWLLDDAAALNLSAQPPASADELFERTRGLRALRSAQRREVLELLQHPFDADDEQTRAIPPALTNSEKRALAKMKDEVVRIAQTLGIADGLLCPRRHLETLLTERAWPAALEGWRKAPLHDALMPLLP